MRWLLILVLICLPLAVQAQSEKPVDLAIIPHPTLSLESPRTVSLDRRLPA